MTGVTRGLGYALAEQMIKRGHIVCGCGRSREQVEMLRQTHGDSHHYYVVDVAKDDAVQDWAKALLSKTGPPDLLVNNAAVINRNAPLWQVSADAFSQVIDINIKGVANVIRHFVPAMIEAARGVVVNLSSGWGRSTAPEVAPYCTSKWAIEGLTQALAQELPKGLAAVALNPGVINTDMLQSCFGAAASSYPSPKQWAERATAFLLKLGPKDNGKALTVP